MPVLKFVYHGCTTDAHQAHLQHTVKSSLMEVGACPELQLQATDPHQSHGPPPTTFATHSNFTTYRSACMSKIASRSPAARSEVDRQHHRRPLPRRPAARARHHVAAAPPLDQHHDEPAADRPPEPRGAAPRIDHGQAHRRPRRRQKPAHAGRLRAVGAGSLIAIVRQRSGAATFRACPHSSDRDDRDDRCVRGRWATQLVPVHIRHVRHSRHAPQARSAGLGDGRGWEGYLGGGGGGEDDGGTLPPDIRPAHIGETIRTASIIPASISDAEGASTPLCIKENTT